MLTQQSPIFTVLQWPSGDTGIEDRDMLYIPRCVCAAIHWGKGVSISEGIFLLHAPRIGDLWGFGCVCALLEVEG